MKPYPEISAARTLVDLLDDRGRPVPKGSEGVIVYVHDKSPPVYILEILLYDENGLHNDSHLVDVRHDQIEPMV